MNQSIKSDGANSPRLVLTLPGSGVEMAFRKITVPKEGFLMGSRGYRHLEEPIHRVKLVADYWLAETPVTQAQFTAWLGAKDHEFGFPDKSLHPAEQMTWNQANEYCAWLTKKCNKQFPAGTWIACFPTEAEWEFACRAGTDTEYYMGDGEAALDEAGWYSGNSNSSTQPVRMREPNKFGLYDMHGNVWEWCHDEWNSKIYRELSDGDEDPHFAMRAFDWEKGVENFTKGERRDRVMRGGSWLNSPVGCRSACRNWDWWSVDRDRNFGFRVCLVPGPSLQARKPAKKGKTNDAPPRTKPEAKRGGGGGDSNKIDLTQESFPREARAKKS